jgi:Listeria/Bacterioides repeat
MLNMQSMIKEGGVSIMKRKTIFLFMATVLFLTASLFAGCGKSTYPPAPPAPPLTLNPSDDSYVQSGTNGDTNYNSETTIHIKNSSTDVNASRKAYLKFDISSLSAVSNAKLRVYAAKWTSSTDVTLQVSGVASDNWTEKTITWNNAPAAAGTLGSVVMTGASGAWQWFEWDVTSFVQSKLGGEVSFVVEDASPTAVSIDVRSKDYGSNIPELVITGQAGTPPEGGTAYTVTYDANGGSGDVPIDSTRYTTGQSVTVQDKGNLTETGYDFGGWNTKGDGTGTPYQPGATFNMGTTNVTLYAQWTPVASGDFLNWDFQNYTGGMLPPGASSVETAPISVWSDVSSYYTYTSVQGPGKDPSDVCMKVEGASAGTYKYPWRLYVTPASMSGTWEMSGEVYMGESPSTARRSLFMFNYLDGATNKYFVTLEFRSDGIYYCKGTITAVKHATATYLPNKWYKVRVIVNFDIGTYSSFLTNLTDDPGTEITIANNESLVATAYNHFTTRIETTAANSQSVTYFDNLRITKQ